MTNRRLIGSVALLALLTLPTAGARAEGEGKYPDWGGQWVRPGGIQFDPTKPLGRGQLRLRPMSATPPLATKYPSAAIGRDWPKAAFASAVSLRWE
jgi:hypothetical protein